MDGEDGVNGANGTPNVDNGGEGGEGGGGGGGGGVTPISAPAAGGMPAFLGSAPGGYPASSATDKSVGASSGGGYIIGPTARRPPLNTPFGSRLAYDRFPNSGSPFGSNWISQDLASLQITGDTITYKIDPNQIEYFVKEANPLDPANPVFNGTFFVRAHVRYFSGSNSYILFQPDGRRKCFNGDGRLKWFTDPFEGTRGDMSYISTTDLPEKMVITYRPTNPAHDPLYEIEYAYGYDTSNRVNTFTYKIKDLTATPVVTRSVRQMRYEYYTNGQLKTYGVWENTAQGTSAPNWQEIDTTFYSYHTAAGSPSTGLLKHIVGPLAYKQMKAVNPTWPELASDADLNNYADRKYAEYDDAYRVKTLVTRGGRYTYGFAYSVSTHSPGSNFNVWTTKTVVTHPDGSGRVLYFNKAGQLMLRRVQDNAASPTTTWNQLYQKFVNGTGRRIESAGADAINTFNEASGGLVTLKANEGMISVYAFDVYGNLISHALKKGTSGTASKLFLRGYTQHPFAGSSVIFKLTSETVYRGEGESDPVTTEWAYTFHTYGSSSTFQVHTLTVKLPKVPVSENGRNVDNTIIYTYDKLGYLTSEVNTRNIETVYEYDVVRGGLTKMIEDKGTGDALNLTTDYEIDDLGRRILAKGPEHTIDLNGTATLVRSARWTYYKDSDDEVWKFGGYIKVSDGSKQAVGPVSIERSYETPTDTTTMSGWRQASLIDVAFTGTGIPAKTATFARSTWVRWSAAFFDKAGEQMQSRLYWLIPSSGDGAVSTNYGKTLYGYDSGGRAIKVVQPGGTITKAVYNAMGWLLSTSIGTDDGSPGNMVLVQENQYDGGTQDVGNLTQVTLHPTASSGSDRVTTFRYDWRLRLEETEATVEADGGGTNTLITKRAYDNRSNVTSLSEFKTNTSSANLIGQRKFYFDTRNRRYRGEVYAVNSSGTASTPQTSNTYYGSCGRALREEPAGSSTFTVTTFDRVSRLEKTYVGYVPSGTSQPTDPTDISTSVIMEQSANAYDAASNLISTLTRSRQDDATGAGVLQDPSTQPKARLAYTAYYPDSLGRQQAVAAYGTNGGSSWTRSATIPTRSDTVLVSSNGYDSAGNTVLTSDPQATLTSFTYDKADRLTIQIENAPASSSSSSSSSSGGSVPSYRTTYHEYTDDGLLKKLKCDDSSTGQQVTEWVYGVDTGKGSALASNVLVYQKIYPDSTGSTDRVTYKYNCLGQATEMKDQAGTVHSYFYDKLGRFLTDLATLAAGSSLDNSIGKIEVGYDVRGLRSRVTSSGPAGYAGSSSSSSSGVTSIVNEVKWAYNDFRQPATEYQEVAGAVNTSTSRKLQYAYASGSANTIRRTSMTLPSGQVVNYDYGTASGLNDKLSRVEAIKDGSTTITSYKYLGTRSFVGVDYTVPGVSLSYDGSGTKFSGLDNFNRVVDLRWKAGSVNKVQAKYGYSRASNRTWRKDQQAHDDGQVTQDQMFWYDGLYQVTNAQRGDLTPGSGPPYTGIAPATRQQNEIFGYDQMGNWLSYYSQSPALSQTRAHNKANEITSLTNPTSVIQPAYDAVGNMTTLPQPADWTKKFTARWDAWNRLIKLTDDNGTTVVATYAYDGLFRRITKTTGSETRKFYYTDSWQVAEEYVGTSSTPQRRYYWGMREINDLIRRQRYSSGTTLQDDLYALGDRMNVVAVVDASGAVQQRMGYSAFGTPIWLTSAWAASTNTKEWNVLFHGHFLDGESGLYQMRFRYFQTGLGRWTSRDPIGETGGFNLYQAFSNDPASQKDVFGLELNFPEPEFPKSTAKPLPDGRRWLGRTNCSISLQISCEPCEESGCAKIKHSLTMDVTTTIPTLVDPMRRDGKVGPAIPLSQNILNLLRAHEDKHRQDCKNFHDYWSNALEANANASACAMDKATCEEVVKTLKNAFDIARAQLDARRDHAGGVDHWAEMKAIEDALQKERWSQFNGGK